MTDTLETMIERINVRAAAMRLKTEKLVASVPQSITCPNHAEEVLALDYEATALARAARYSVCRKCNAERLRTEQRERLTRQGVPVNLLDATFENWMVRDEHDEAIRSTALEFSRARRGFLLLLGDYGTGKSHLAVAILKTFKSAMMVKQSELLRRLRQTYRDKAAVDPVDEAQDVACLALDEIGLSAGGRDELPLLHDVLDFRHSNQKPTILTGNVSVESLCNIIGERMADRLRESCFARLNFVGESHRRDAREKYFWNRED